MSTNMCSRSRSKYISVKQFAEQYSMSKQAVYKIIKNSYFEDAVMKIGTRGVRVKQDLLFDLMQKYYK